MFNQRVMQPLVLTILILLICVLLYHMSAIVMNVYQFARAVLAPFLIAVIISYVLHPIVTMLHQRKVPRPIAVLLIYAVFCGSVTVILLNAIPAFVEQLEQLNEHLPQFTMKTRSIVEDWKNSRFMSDPIRDGMTSAWVKFEKQLSLMMTTMINNIDAMINLFFIACIIPFLAFYMLKDFDMLERTVMKLVPQKHRVHATRMFKDIDKALGNYIRGQLIVCVVIGVLAYIGYLIVDMPYPLLLASFVALTNIIPYVGPFFGAAPAIFMASTISFKMVLLVLVINTVCQVVESNVISPQIVGRKLHMHPLSIIFALLVGGELAGVIGLILAVPVFAVLKVFVQHAKAFYTEQKNV